LPDPPQFRLPAVFSFFLLHKAKVVSDFADKNYVKHTIIGLVWAAGLSILPGSLAAQTEFRIGDYKFQAHSFFSQGFMYSGNNNYLSAATTKGSFGMTDGGANLSTQITDKFRVGAQVYFYNVGQLGAWKPELDWAYGSYQFKDWFGVRAGKVKTTFGLYNDTQDLAFLQTFAMLPQALYPIDRRDESIAHTGGDLFGTVQLAKAGSASYTGFVGNFSDTPDSGYIYSLKPTGIQMKNYGGFSAGGDLRWNAPLPGLVVGGSYMLQYPHGSGDCVASRCVSKNKGGIGPYWEKERKDFSIQLYGQYTIDKFRLYGEHRRTERDHTNWSGNSNSAFDMRAFYVAGTYKLARKWEMGSYYSRSLIHYTGPSATPALALTHILDKVISVRYDVTSFWNVKLEGHFMNGNGLTFFPWGFYSPVNPAGFKDKTPLLVARSSWYF
jgi:hypothetical protein